MKAGVDALQVRPGSPRSAHSLTELPGMTVKAAEKQVVRWFGATIPSAESFFWKPNWLKVSVLECHGHANHGAATERQAVLRCIDRHAIFSELTGVAFASLGPSEVPSCHWIWCVSRLHGLEEPANPEVCCERLAPLVHAAPSLP